MIPLPTSNTHTYLIPLPTSHTHTYPTYLHHTIPLPTSHTHLPYLPTSHDTPTYITHTHTHTHTYPTSHTHLPYLPTSHTQWVLVSFLKVEYLLFHVFTLLFITVEWVSVVGSGCCDLIRIRLHSIILHNNFD